MPRPKKQNLRKLVRNEINRNLAPETKIAEISPTSQTISSTAAVVASLYHIAQGDGQEQRTGNRLLAKAVKMRWSLHRDTSLASLARVILVRDNQQVADSTPSATTFFGAGITNPVIAFKDLANRRGRFDVLMDRTYEIGPAGSGKENHFDSLYLPVNHRVGFNGPLNTDIQKGGVYLIACTNSADVNKVAMAFSTEVNFTDC